MKGESHPSIHNPGKFDIGTAATNTKVQNIFSVAQAVQAKLQIIHKYIIYKGQVDSWETSTHIFTHGYFLHINITKSKSYSETSLERINLSIGVENCLFMDNVPELTGYNTETQRFESQVIINVYTTETYDPWENISESVIIIIRRKYRRIRFHINITNRVWHFGMDWETNIYSRTAVNYWNPSLEP